MRLDGFKLKHLRMLVALSEHKKVGTVAQMFGLSQPSLSRTLSELESLAGHRLFERHNRGTLLTPEGEVLARYARTLLSDAARAEYDMDMLASGKRGSVSIGTIMTPASDFVVPALTSVHADHAHLDFNISVGSSDMLLSQLMAGQLDFAVCRIAKGFNERLFTYVPLGFETLRMVVAPDHPLAGKGAVSRTDLEGLDWVLQQNGSMLRQIVDDYHRQNGIIPKSIVSTSSTLLTILLVRGSRRVGIFAGTAADLFDSHGLMRSIRIEADIEVPGFGLIHLKDRELSAQARTVYNALLALAEVGKTAVPDVEGELSALARD